MRGRRTSRSRGRGDRGDAAVPGCPRAPGRAELRPSRHAHARRLAAVGAGVGRRRGRSRARRYGEGSLKARNTRRDPRVSLSVVAMDNPYREAQLRGRVVERRPDAKFEVMDRISRKYIGKEFPMRANPEQRVVLVIEVQRVRYTVLPFSHTPRITGG